jgi:hypothetical protein
MMTAIGWRRGPVRGGRRRARWLAVLVVVILALLVGVRHLVPRQSSPLMPAVSGMAGAGHPIALGVTMPDAPASMTALQAYIRMAGRPPAIVMYFRSFGAPFFYSTEAANLRAIGATPMVTLDPVIGSTAVPLAQIAAGVYDGYLNQQAHAAVAWGRAIYVRFAQEMNLPNNPWATGVDGNTPALFVAAWRHMVALFRRDGATNVRWVWSPNVMCGTGCGFTQYFPGDAWVSDVALDAYNYSTAHDVPWMSFATLFTRSYDILTRLSTRPVIIGETASSEEGGDKAKWIQNAFFRVIPSTFRRLTAVIWWDRVDQADWTVNSSPQALAAWRQVVASPRYR